MATAKPIYTAKNTTASFRLQWSITVFWRAPLDTPFWFEELRDVCIKDHVRILNHRQVDPKCSQFLVSASPSIAPVEMVRSVKGRLQHLVRVDRPRAFQRNYFIGSVGAMRRAQVEKYVASQLNHHRMADPRVQQRLAAFQISRSNIDLAQRRPSSHGLFVYTMHLVLCRDGRWMETREDVLRKTHDMLIRVARAKGHLLSRAGILPDHVHLVLGCDRVESPESVALSYLNNLAYAEGMKPVYQAGYYVGTVGEYDTGAIR